MTNTLAGSVVIGTDFKFVIDEEVYAKVMHWVDKSSHEVSGFGSIEWDKEKKIFRVTDAILLDQDNSPTSSEISPHAIGKAMFQMKDNDNALKWWWHSHVNMSVFWSGDDMNCIRGLGQQGWITATVFNKKRECRSAYYQLTDVMDNKHEVFVDEIPTTIDYKLDLTKIAEWDKSYDEHVTEKKYVASKYIHSKGDTKHHDYSKGKEYQRKHDDYYAQMYLDDYGYGKSNHWERGLRDWADDTLTVKDFSADKVELQRQAALVNPNSYGLTEDWDSEGWRMNPRTNDYQYNPVRDKALKAEEIWQQIAQMDQEEFDGLVVDDVVFRTYLHSEITGMITK